MTQTVDLYVCIFPIVDMHMQNVQLVDYEPGQGWVCPHNTPS